MGLMIGVGRADITAPVGAHLSGYAARKTPAVGICDDLCATALYLEQGDVRAAVIALDLLHLGPDETDELRRRCERQSGVPAANVLIACSHTHGGPALGLGPGDDVRVAYTDCLFWRAAGALTEARHTARECRIGHARKEALVACNRRERTPEGVILGVNPDGPRPTVADVLAVTPLSGGAPLAVGFVYGCHGTTLGGDNYLVTADYQGVARRFVEGQMPGTRGFFLPGCGANQNPYPRGTFEHARQHGTRLGAAALAAEPTLKDALAKVAKKDPVLRAEAIAMRRSGNRVFLAGTTDESHYYAAAELLRRWGCRWYLPTDFGECIPEMPRLTIGDLDVAYAPPFEIRKYWISWNGDSTGKEEFMRRNFFNDECVPNGHALAQYVSELIPKGKTMFNVPIAEEKTIEHVAKKVSAAFGRGERIIMGMEDGIYQSDSARD
ncbi:MAG TPA: hypothetical protein PLD23_01320, partial [Armatimonadota bacterium]|nr:hypothetical protein [Armatimonadota bacterium]